jgi:hypothetical protein
MQFEQAPGFFLIGCGRHGGFVRDAGKKAKTTLQNLA